MSERQARVTEEREGEVGLSPDAREARAEGAVKGTELRRAHVGEFATFDVPPDLFDRVQFRRVGGQSFDGEPRPLASKVGGHGAALMCAQAVPEENHSPSPEVALEGAQEADQREVLVAARLRVEVEARPPGVPAERQRPGHREPFPVPAGVGQDGRVPAGRPRPADDGLL